MPSGMRRKEPPVNDNRRLPHPGRRPGSRRHPRSRARFRRRGVRCGAVSVLPGVGAGRLEPAPDGPPVALRGHRGAGCRADVVDAPSARPVQFSKLPRGLRRANVLPGCCRSFNPKPLGDRLGDRGRSQPPLPRTQPEPRRAPRPRRGAVRHALPESPTRRRRGGSRGRQRRPVDPPRQRGGENRSMASRLAGCPAAPRPWLGPGVYQCRRSQPFLLDPARSADLGRHPGYRRRRVAARRSVARGAGLSPVPRRVVRAGAIHIRHPGDVDTLRRRPRLYCRVSVTCRSRIAFTQCFFACC
jgi:hypothetical protein